MATVLGTLTIDLKANTASFAGAMDKMSHLSLQTANDVKRSLDRIAVAGLAMAAAVASGTAALISHALDAGDKLDELAQSSGTTTETLSTLGYAAKFSGVSTEDLSGSLVKLSKSAFAAKTGNDGLEKVFQKLGVSVTDSNGHLKDSGELFQEIAPRFSAMADGAGKTALALQLFGKSGASIIPILNQLGESNGELIKEARQFGLVVGGDTAKAAADVNDDLDKLKSSFQGVGLSILSEALPALKDLTGRLLDLSKSANITDIAKAFGAKVATAIRATGDAMEFAVKHAHALKIALETLAALQVIKIAIPILAELTSDSLTAGVTKFVTGLLGLSKLQPVLSKLSTGITAAVSDTLFLARAEGVATTATYLFGEALTFLAAHPVIVALTAFALVGTALYKLKQANDDAREAADKHRRELLKNGQITIPPALKGVRLTDPGPSRADQITSLLAFKPAADKAKKPAEFDTDGLGKKEKDIYGEEIRKLDQAIASQRAFLAVLNATPEKIQAAASAERANGIILEKNNALREAGRGVLSAQQEATIRSKVATEDATKALVDYGRSIVDQQRGAELSIAQQTRLAAAAFDGEEATRRAGVENTILGLTFGKTAEQVESMRGGLEKLSALLTRKVESEGLAAFAKTLDDQQRALRLAIAQTEALGIAQSGGEAAIEKATIDNAILALTYNKTAKEIEALRPKIEELRRLQGQKVASDSFGELAKSIRDQQTAIALSIQQTLNLAAAQADGEGAVRAAVAANALLSLTYGKSAEDVARLSGEIGKLTEQQRRKAALDRLDSVNKDVFDLSQTLGSGRGLPEALIAGEEAYRRATVAARLFNLEQQITNEDDDKVIAALRRKRDLIIQVSEAEFREADAREALTLRSPAAKYNEETAALRRQIDVLTGGGKRALDYGEALQVAAKQQDLLNAAIDEQVKLLTRTGKASDGVSAFFLNLQKQAKTTSAIIYDALNSAFDKLTDNLTELVTGGKTNFAQAFKDIGKQIIGDTIKSQIQVTLGSIGKALGVGIGQKRDGQSAGTGLWVQVAGSGSAPTTGSTSMPGFGDAIGKAIRGVFGGGSSGGFVFHLSDSGMSKGVGPNVAAQEFGKPDGRASNPFFVMVLNQSAAVPAAAAKSPGIWSQIFSAVGSAVSMIAGSKQQQGIRFDGPRAAGGPVNPRSAYLVGERGPEIATGLSGRVYSNADSKNLLGGGPTYTYNVSVDARGTDPALVEQRVQRAILAAHNSAVSTAVQAQIEFRKRTPGGR